MKPLMKLCKETNQLVKEILKQTTEQTRLINALINVPRELQKTTQQLSHIVHTRAPRDGTGGENEKYGGMLRNKL